ncbi:DUF2194 domain-containing protein [Bacillus sp. 2205SS5-2]|uniref:DUF2194 domain-containing protein n=1 Tax=Bacillus sp. 2205SS5-2 TaxID=3109031 RepID=UPI003005D89E
MKYKVIIWGVFGVIVTIILFLQMFSTTPSFFYNEISGNQPLKVETMLSQEQSIKDISLQIYLIEPRTESSLSNQIQVALNNARLPFQLIKEKDLSTLTPTPYKILITVEESYSEYPFDVITSFVEKGGRLLITKRDFSPKWSEWAGAEKQGDYMTEDIFGLTFKENLFPAYEDISPHENDAENFIAHSSLDMTLKKETTLYIESEGVPIFWTYEQGEGKIGFWNTTWLETKLSRGLFLQSLSLLPPVFVSSFAGVEVVFIDDFPAPYRAEFSQIREQFNVSTKSFFKNIWWKQMKDLAKKHDLKYTSAMIGLYTDTYQPNSPLISEGLNHRLLFYGRDIFLNGHELGLHGYNHQSLVTKNEPVDEELGYVPWRNKQQMMNSLANMEEIMKKYYPNQQFYTYVPPSNIINETGLSALKKEVESLEVISSLYNGEEGTASLIQEYEVDTEDSSIFHLPRISSGYNLEEVEEYAKADALANFGMFSHFIHPDDFLDEERAEGRTWNNLYQDFDDFLTETNKVVPILSSYTARQAASYLRAYLEAQPTIAISENTLFIQGELPKPYNLLIRLNGFKGEIEPNNQNVSVYQLNKGLFMVQLNELPIQLMIQSDAQRVEEGD